MGKDDSLRISSSALSTFDICPRQYRFKYVEKRPSQASRPAEFGVLVHSVLQNAGNAPHIIKLCEDAEPLLKDFAIKFLLSESDVAQERVKVESMLREAIRIIKSNPSRVSERKIEVKVDDFIVVGVVDRIDAGGVVQDWKTGKYIPSFKEAASSWQSSIYPFLVRVLEIVPKHILPGDVAIEYLYLKYGVTYTIPLEDNIRGRTERRLRKAVKEIRNSKFEPIQSPLCKSCSYSGICSSMTKGQQIQKKEDKQYQGMLKFD